MIEKNITYEHLFTDELKKTFNEKEDGNKKRIYSVMEFKTEFEVGLSSKPYEWVNSYSFITLDGAEALHKYIFNTNPMTEIIDAESFEELNEKMINMTNNYKNKNYINNKVETRFY